MITETTRSFPSSRFILSEAESLSDDLKFNMFRSSCVEWGIKIPKIQETELFGDVVWYERDSFDCAISAHSREIF